MGSETETLGISVSCELVDSGVRSLRWNPPPFGGFQSSPAARSLDDGSIVPPSRFPPMNRQTESADAVVRHALDRGVYSQPYGTGRVYFSVSSDGTQGTWRLPIGDETPADVIVALGDALDRDDPQTPPSSRRPSSTAAAAAPRAQHLRLLA
jgi:hypothetical protein